MAQKLEEMILNGVFKSGDRLPPERKLAEQFEVSRPSVREAIQILKAKRLLTSRQGGGNYVNPELGNGMVDPLFTLYEQNPSMQSDLLEFRITLESECAAMAAKRATEPDLRHLTDCFDKLMRDYQSGDPAQEARSDVGFHLAIAEASHNVLFLHTIKSLFDLLQRTVTTNLTQLFTDADSKQQLRDQHEAIYRAIMARQPEQARAEAVKHLQYVRECLLEVQQSYQRQQTAELRERILKPEAH